MISNFSEIMLKISDKEQLYNIYIKILIILLCTMILLFILILILGKIDDKYGYYPRTLAKSMFCTYIICSILFAFMLFIVFFCYNTNILVNHRDPNKNYLIDLNTQIVDIVDEEISINEKIEKINNLLSTEQFFDNILKYEKDSNNFRIYFENTIYEYTYDITITDTDT